MTMLPRIKDRISLLAVALGCAVLAWGFFHYLSEWAIVVLLALTTVTLACERITRLRQMKRQS